MDQTRHVEPRRPVRCIAMVIFTALVQVAFAQAPKMMQADHAFVEAASKGEKAVLEKLLDAEFIWIGADGKMLTKRQVMEAVPRMAIADADDRNAKSYAYGDLGNVQVNVGRAHVVRVWAQRSGTWKALVYQEVISRETPPPFTPGAGKDCVNPCASIPFRASNQVEQEVAVAYMALETAAHARKSMAFAHSVGDEFAAASSNSDKLQTKRSRMAEFDRAKDGGLAPTPLTAARMIAFGDAVLMLSEHQPDRGEPLRVTRIWVNRNGTWVETLSYQTSITAGETRR